MSNKAYLSIEYFKTPQAQKLLNPPDSFRVFESSGTTSKDRSQVGFSNRGLRLYRERALKDFTLFLREHFPSCEPADIKGYSLVPPASRALKSSLSQMVTWIAEEYDVSFISGSDLEKIESVEPVWIFGTGFDWWHFSRNLPTQPHTLNNKSLVIDTGGMKALEVEQTESQIIERLRCYFGLSSERFASEYGMCELSCQAYTVYSSEGQASYGERRFRFGSDVKLSVVSPSGECSPFGRGALLVDDPKRIDVESAILTQDLVDLFSDGTFSIRGRVKTSALKSCSLTQRDEVLQNVSSDHELFERVKFAETFSSGEERRRTILQMQEAVEGLLGDCEVPAFLAKEFLCEEWSARFLADFFVGFEVFEPVLQHSAEPILFIPSATHSFSQLYPIAWAVLQHRPVLIRDPFPKGERRFFHWFLDRIFGEHVHEVLLPKEFRLGPLSCKSLLESNREKYFTVVLSSDNSTRSEIKSYIEPFKAVSLQSFSETDTIAVVSLDWVFTIGSAEEILYQAFSLMQGGCRNLRAIYIVSDCKSGPDLQLQIKNLLVGAFKKLNVDKQKFAEYEFGILFEKLLQEIKPEPGVECPYFYFPEESEPKSLRQFCLPIRIIEEADVNSVVSSRLTVNKEAGRYSLIGTSPDLLDGLREPLVGVFPTRSFCIQAITNLQTQSWNGEMDGKRLFVEDETESRSV